MSDGAFRLKIQNLKKEARKRLPVASLAEARRREQTLFRTKTAGALHMVVGLRAVELRRPLQ
jgi:hypothetical protein